MCVLHAQENLFVKKKNGTNFPYFEKLFPSANHLKSKLLHGFISVVRKKPGDLRLCIKQQGQFSDLAFAI
jgi:hypothetical protein